MWKHIEPEKNSEEGQAWLSKPAQSWMPQNIHIFLIRTTAVPWPLHITILPLAECDWQRQFTGNHGERRLEETCSVAVRPCKLWGTMCSLAHADNTRARFLCIFVQIGLKYLKKPSLNHFSWQKHLQADTSQLQNQYLHVWFFFPIWYFKQLNWLAGTNHCSAHWEPSFAQAPIYKSLSLSETWPILNAVKPVQAQATMLIQFQLGTTEIQLQITCVQTHWGTARESGSQFLLLCQHGLSKTIYSSQSARTFRTLNHTF